MAKREIINYYDVDFASYAGILVNEKLMRKLAKLQAKQLHELKTLFANNLDDLEVSSWTLAYPNGEQKVVKYFNKDFSYSEKLERIEVLNHIANVKKLDRVYKVSGGDWSKNREDVEKLYEEEFYNDN